MKLPISTEKFRIPGPKETGKAPRLNELPTKVEKVYSSKKEYRARMEESTGELQDLQKVLYAHGRFSLLLIFQGMDTAGKDGAIRHVMSGVNPQGCQVFSFKQPSQEELAHDYLWRTSKRLPRRGHIGIFNRSYYEEVLIVKAVPAVLRAQLLPEGYAGDKQFWQNRYDDIMQFEKYLARNGTRIIKFFLHISKEEQRQRLLSRANQPDKNWKLSSADLESRAQWDCFQKVYEECLQNTSHDAAPWYSIPADNKRNARLIVSDVIIRTLEALPLSYPTPDKKQLAEVERVRQVLSSETDG